MLGKDMPSNSMQSHEYFPHSSFHLECISDIYIYHSNSSKLEAKNQNQKP